MPKSGRPDDTVGHWDPLFDADTGCGHGQILIKINDRSYLHMSYGGQSDIFVELDQELLEDFID